MMFKFNSQFITNRNPTRGFFMVLTAFTAGIVIVNMSLPIVTVYIDILILY